MLLGKSRQAFYYTKNCIAKDLYSSSIIVELVSRERKIAKRVGGKKLYAILKGELILHDVNIGRDLFFEVLRDHNLLVKRRRKYVQTTMSRHRFHKYPNCAKDLKIDCAEQLWVSDITYLRVCGKHYYLILITDAYSRKVVGYNFGAKMDTEFCLVALQMALDGRQYPERKLMHHSDRGVQYCSAMYVDLLNENSIKISMTENGDPLENALAERMNRTFKDTFGLDEDFVDFETAQQAVENAIEYYNTRLPHSSLDKLTPQMAHHRKGALKKHWRWYWKEKQEEQQKQNETALLT